MKNLKKIVCTLALATALVALSAAPSEAGSGWHGAPRLNSDSLTPAATMESAEPTYSSIPSAVAELIIELLYNRFTL